MSARIRPRTILNQLQPFGPLVWPGTGPQADLTRNWPELAVIALVVLFFWRGAAGLAPAGWSDALAASAGLHPLYAFPALLGLAPGAALLLSALAAAFGAWWLGVVLGAGRLGRGWAALAYAGTGLAASAFSVGRFGLALGSAWIPWALAFGIAAVEGRRSLHVALAGGSLALIFLAGDAGLAAATLIALAFFLAVLGIGPRPALRRAEVVLALMLAGLGLGLAALRLLPLLAAGPAGMTSSADLDVGWRLGLLIAPGPGAVPAGIRGTIGVAALLFLVGLPLYRRSGNARRATEVAATSARSAAADPNRPAAAGLALVAAVSNRPVRSVLLLGLLALAGLSGGWLDGAGLPAGLLAWGLAGLLALGGAGLSAAWDWALAHLALRRVNVPAAVRWALGWLGVVGLAAVAFFSVVSLYRANRLLLAASEVGSAGARWSLVQGLAGFYLDRHPVAFVVGVIMSSLSLVGFVTLIIGDVRRRRSRLETEAVYAEGVLRPAAPLGIPDGTPVHVTVEAETAGEVEDKTEAKDKAEVEEKAEAEAKAEVGTRVAPARVAPASRSTLTSTSSSRSGVLLFAVALLVYLFTRLYAVDRFPIYFFADEATHAVYAQDLIDRGFQDAQGHFLPIYFEAAGNRWTPLLSVYVHAISVGLFGKSIFVTRATSALVSVLAAVAVVLILRLGFRSRYWWAGALLMAVAPAWFLHSRTGFETVMMASFFACTLLCYLLYRTRSPRYLYATILFGAATFYTYSNGQMVMAAFALFVLIADLRYHLKNWRTLLPALLLIALVAIPVLRFRAQQPASMTTHLRAIDSYLFHSMPASEKALEFLKRFAYGLSPSYWFIPNSHDLARHIMKGYGHLNIWLLPFLLVGVGLCLWRVKQPAHRAILLAALATPVGAALVDVSITRVLAFIPVASVLIGLGLDAALEWLNRRGRIPYWITAGVLCVALSGASLWMLRDALVNGPRWFSDYGLYGMQYGAKQLFEEEIPALLRENPNATIMMTSTWANGADTFIRFFMPKEQAGRVQMLNVDYFMQMRRDLNPNMVLVMTPNEYQRAQASGKFKTIDVLRTVPYPDGTPGFYFARMAYADDLETIIQQEREARSRPVTETVTIDGQPVEITHSQFDMGLPPNLFDGDTFTLVRGLEANPLILEFTFPEPRAITRLAADFASMDFTLTAKLYAAEGAEPKVYSQTFQNLPPDPHVEMAFAGAPAVKKLRLEVLQLNAPLDPHIHVRELKFIQ